MVAIQASKRVIHGSPGSIAREEIEEQVAESEKQEIPPSPHELKEMMAVAAYYHALRRDFAPGHELEDWLAAETEIADRPGIMG